MNFTCAVSLRHSWVTGPAPTTNSPLRPSHSHSSQFNLSGSSVSLAALSVWVSCCVLGVVVHLHRRPPCHSMKPPAPLYHHLPLPRLFACVIHVWLVYESAPGGTGIKGSRPGTCVCWRGGVWCLQHFEAISTKLWVGKKTHVHKCTHSQTQSTSNTLLSRPRW